MPGKRDGLLADAFHQVAVGGEHIGAVIDHVAEFSCEMPFGNRHADRVADALAERAGGGLDARGDEILRMSRRDRTDLAEALDLLDGHRLRADQMQQRVDQHRAVTGREHEAVAVRPFQVGGIEFQEACEQDGGDIRRAHRQAGMPGLRLLDGVHREGADGVGHAVVFGAAGGLRSGDRGCRRGLYVHGRAIL